LSRAEHRRGGRIKARGLFESAEAQAKEGESPRAQAETWRSSGASCRHAAFSRSAGLPI